MVNRSVDALLTGLFPDYCSLCGLPSHRPLPLCVGCESELRANTHCCDCCAIPLPEAPTPPAATLCGRCQQAAPPFQRVVAPWLYCERLAHLIQRWKFHGERRLTPLLATLWLQRAGGTHCADLLLPVPLHWRRLWQRGFNQSELLCRQLRALAPGVASATLDHRPVRRKRATPAQAGMGAIQRSANLSGAFTAARRYDNLRVAIVDDVFTTGATAAALAAVLHQAGASQVEVWCLARTPAPGS